MPRSGIEDSELMELQTWVRIRIYWEINDRESIYGGNHRDSFQHKLFAAWKIQYYEKLERSFPHDKPEK